VLTPTSLHNKCSKYVPATDRRRHITHHPIDALAYQLSHCIPVTRNIFHLLYTPANTHWLVHAAIDIQILLSSYIHTNGKECIPPLPSEDCRYGAHLSSLGHTPADVFVNQLQKSMKHDQWDDRPTVTCPTVWHHCPVAVWLVPN